VSLTLLWGLCVGYTNYQQRDHEYDHITLDNNVLTNVLALVYWLMFMGSMPMLHNGQQVDLKCTVYTHDTWYEYAK